MKTTGIVLFVLALFVFVASLSLSNHQLTEAVVKEQIGKAYHQEMILQQAGDILNKTYGNNIAFLHELKRLLESCKKTLDQKSGVDPEKGVWNAVNLPQGVSEWDYRMSDSDIRKPCSNAHGDRARRTARHGRGGLRS